MEEARVQLEEPEMTAIEKLAARRNSKTEKPKAPIIEEMIAYEKTHIKGNWRGHCREQ